MTFDSLYVFFTVLHSGDMLLYDSVYVMRHRLTDSM